MPTEIRFYKINKRLKVTIDTDRLHLESVSEEKYIPYCNLFTNSINMEKYSTSGIPWDPQKVRLKLNNWIEKWQSDIPFSAFSIEKNDVDGVIGHIALKYTHEPGTAELSYVIDRAHWGRRYGNESATVIVKSYTPELIIRNYTINGIQFSKIVASVRPENLASVKILQNVGMDYSHEGIKNGHKRYFFYMNTSDIEKPNPKFTPTNKSTVFNNGTSPLR